MTSTSLADPPLTAPVPPQNLEAEENVLGAMVLSPNAIASVVDLVAAEDFYRESHGIIFKAAVDLDARGVRVDAITLTDALEENGQLENVGGRVRIHELAALVPATANAGFHAKIVRNMATLRGLIEAGGEVAKLGWERPGETDALVERAMQTVFELTQARIRSRFRTIGELLKENYDRLQALFEAGLEVTGVPSGFTDLDRLTSGFQPGNLVILAARPSMGKSALGLGIAANLSIRREIPVALFTLEMSESEVTQRLMCMEAKIDSQRLRAGKLSVEEWSRLASSSAPFETAPLHIDDGGALTLVELRAKTRRLLAKEPGLGLIILDYMQLMESGEKAENRQQDVSKVSRALKVLAGEIRVPILALSQLSRAVESRHDKRPILSDLRESGSLEQDADVVAFVYRDEYYNDDSDQQGIAEIIVAKQRNGPTDTVKLAFIKRYARFADLVIDHRAGVA